MRGLFRVVSLYNRVSLAPLRQHCPARLFGANLPLTAASPGGRRPSPRLPEGATEAALPPGTAPRLRGAASSSPFPPSLPPWGHGRLRRSGAAAPPGRLGRLLPLPHVGAARPGGAAAAGAAGGPRRLRALLIALLGLAEGPAALLPTPPPPPPPPLGQPELWRHPGAAPARGGDSSSSSSSRPGSGHPPQEGADGGAEHGAGSPRLHLQPALHRAELPAAGAAPLRVHRHRPR